MSTRDFLFALQISGEPPCDDLLGEVAARVLGSVGYGEDIILEVIALMQGALAEGMAEGPGEREVQFVVQGRELHIAVTCVGGRMWRTSYPIG